MTIKRGTFGAAPRFSMFKHGQTIINIHSWNVHSRGDHFVVIVVDFILQWRRIRGLRDRVLCRWFFPHRRRPQRLYGVRLRWEWRRYCSRNGGRTLLPSPAALPGTLDGHREGSDGDRATAPWTSRNSLPQDRSSLLTRSSDAYPTGPRLQPPRLKFIFLVLRVSLRRKNAAASLKWRRCLVPECENSSESSPYAPPWLRNALPFDSNGKPTECTRYAVNGGANWTHATCPADGFFKNVTQKCHNLVFLGEEVTIVNDFHLTCPDNKWKLTLIGTMNFVGQFVGLPLAGMLSDRFGRRTVMVGALLGQSICGISKSFAPNYFVYISLEFLEAFSGGAVFPTLFVLALELVGPSRRAFCSVCINVAYSVGSAYLPLIAWALPYWRHMLLALYSPALITIMYLWLIPESLRWLISRGRVEEACEVVKKAAVRNGVVLSDEAMSIFNNNNNTLDFEDTGSGTKVNSGEEIPKTLRKNMAKEMVASKTLLLRLFVNCLCWTAVTMVYYGLSLGAVTLSGNRYVNFAVTALVEMPGNILVLPVMERLGRRTSAALTFILSGITCLAVPFLPHEGGESWLSTVAFLLGKIFITGSFNTLYTYSSEMFPTGLRSSSLAACSTFGRVGSMLAPQAPLLAVYGASLPYIVFGAVAMLAGFSSLVLPETLHAKLPETVAEAEHLGRKKKTSIPQI
ncbi:organic cation transporter protein-like [Hetaerina americana]|uniref:organic cation transporter protein-like n=1 Tax=Hetaerina americana TaxID=62018 RepID=UPI003A7F5BD3